MMRVESNPPSAVGWARNYLFLLAHEDAAGVGWIAAVEGEQQIQGWEVKDINLRATAWACAGKNICNAIAIVDYQFRGC